MTYSVNTDFGQRELVGGGYGHAVMAPCGITLGREVAADPYFRDLTNLGQLGDTTHYTQGYWSDHNPFVTHNGLYYVRAMDFGGPETVQRRFFDFLRAMYGAHDARLWAWGYPKGTTRNLIVDWPPGTGVHVNTGDAGHVHLSFTQRDGRNPSPNGWVDALGSTASWGLSNWRQTGKLAGVIGVAQAARPATPTQPPTTPGDDGVKAYSLVRFGKLIYITNGITARQLKTLNDVRRMQAYLKRRGGDPVIINHDPRLSSIATYGRVI